MQAVGIPITEERLLASVRGGPGTAGPAVVVPTTGARHRTRRDDRRCGAEVGVPVASFPRWLVCPQCRLLAPIGSGLFELVPHLYRPEKAHYRHRNCSARKVNPALPIRVPDGVRAGASGRFSVGGLFASRSALRDAGVAVPGTGKRRRTLRPDGGVHAVSGGAIAGRGAGAEWAISGELLGSAAASARLPIRRVARSGCG